MFKGKNLLFFLISLLLAAGIGYVVRPYVSNFVVTQRNSSTSAEKMNKKEEKMASETETKKESSKKGTSKKGISKSGSAYSRKKYKGKAISAVLPDTWTIVERFNGAGSSMLVEGVTYQGLTGVEVLNASHVVVFKMEAVNGVGGVDACSEYYKFSDDNPQYYQQVLTDAQAVGLSVSIVDLSTQPYSEFTFLGKTFRRIGSKLYWDTQPGNDTFEAACGMSAHIIQFPSLSFTADGVTDHGYQISIKNSPSDADLAILDKVLATVHAL